MQPFARRPIVNPRVLAQHSRGSGVDRPDRACSAGRVRAYTCVPDLLQLVTCLKPAFVNSFIVASGSPW